MKLRALQIEPADEAARNRSIERHLRLLRERWPDQHLGADRLTMVEVEQWIADARAWGLRSEAAVARYVLACAEAQRRHDPLEVRIIRLLMIRQATPAAEDALERVAGSAVGLCRRYGIVEDEGAAWLAAILLEGERQGDQDLRWIGPLLDQGGSGESRLRRVHAAAVMRGWLADAGSTG